MSVPVGGAGPPPENEAVVSIPELPRGTGEPATFSSCSRLSLEWGDEVTYRRLRSFEPGLVSVCDGGEAPSVLTLQLDGRPEGALSLVTTENPQRSSPRNSYGRIDLVIVEPGARGLGLGRVLILSGLGYLLRDDGPCLYSISCLAAHGAVAKVLEDVGFVGEERADQNFTLMKISVEDEGMDVLLARFEKATGHAVTNAAFRIRQRLGPAPPRGTTRKRTGRERREGPPI